MVCWTRVLLLVLCVGFVAADDRMARLMRLGQRIARLPPPRRGHHHHHHHRHRRPSVPEKVPTTTPAPIGHRARELQAQRLWDEAMARYQSDQPADSWSTLKLQLARKEHVNRMRGLGPERAFNDDALQNDNELISAAHENFKTVSMNYSCYKPHRQLVPVSEEHPSSSLLYMPPSVLLRRCSDQSGCCYGDASCVASRDTVVHRAVMVTNPIGRGSSTSRPESLKFTEHVECHCVPRSRRPQCSDGWPQPLNDASSESADDHGRKHGKLRDSHPLKKPKQSKQQTCRCPRQFVSRPFADGSCTCDCFDGDKKCRRTKRGITYMPEDQNRCIVQGKCDPPDCSHGKYRTRASRCPRKHERRQLFNV